MKSDKKPAPPATGMRQQWDDIPQKLRDMIEDHLGSTVIKAETQTGGFSPGVAARIYTEDNQCVFLKAMGTDINATSIRFHRNELAINKSFPPNAFAPKLLWSYDDADDSEWIVMVFDNIEGINPPTPWQTDDLHRVVNAMSQLSEILTPAPLQSVPSASDHFKVRINGWQRIQSGELFAKLDDWSTRHIKALCDLEAQGPQAVAGDTLVHFDMRADNMVMNDNGIWFVDWPHAARGTQWLDLVLFAPSVAMQGGLSPEELLQLNPVALQADSDALTAAIASMAGNLTFNSLLPSPKGLPTLRAFQATQGEVARQWLAERTGLS